MEIDEINSIFGVQETPDVSELSDPKTADETDSFSEDKINIYNGDKITERDYRPVRRGREYRTGCLGGIMYFVFILCASIVLACLAWMAASDVLALNNEDFTSEVVLQDSYFSSELQEVYADDGTYTGSKTVTHADIDSVTSELKDAGLIQYPWLFKFFCRISHASEKLNPGEYSLKSSYDYRALVQHMRSGNSEALTVLITFPEGFTMNQIFKKLEENGVCSYDSLIEAASNYKFNYSFLENYEAGEASRLEGYLFPDTYEFYVDMQASSAINKFLKRYYDILTADMQKQAKTLGLSMNEVIIIASLIEKEAAVDVESGINDRATISSVINNRLNADMSLGIDATILYVHQDWEGQPSKEMLEEDSPYNTRIVKGLPPTPICNPGLDAINAALNPEKTNYRYYALDTSTGTHRFFSNYYEHKEFVETQDYG